MYRVAVRIRSMLSKIIRFKLIISHKLTSHHLSNDAKLTIVEIILVMIVTAASKLISHQITSRHCVNYAKLFCLGLIPDQIILECSPNSIK